MLVRPALKSVISTTPFLSERHGLESDPSWYYPSNYLGFMVAASTAWNLYFTTDCLSVCLTTVNTLSINLS
jgi:hypothetical protein